MEKRREEKKEERNKKPRGLKEERKKGRICRKNRK